MCGAPEHAGHVLECGRRPGPGTPSRLGRGEKSQESTRPQKSKLWCHQVVRLPSALMGFLCSCGKGEAADTVIKWEAGDNYLIHFRKDGSPRRKKEPKTRHRDGMMWPSQCGVPWETTKPPKKTLHPAGGNMLSTVRPETSPQNPGAVGRGDSTGLAPEHGDTIITDTSCLPCVEGKGEISFSLHKWIQMDPKENKWISSLPPPVPQFLILQPNKRELCCYCFIFQLAF